MPAQTYTHARIHTIAHKNIQTQARTHKHTCTHVHNHKHMHTYTHARVCTQAANLGVYEVSPVQKTLMETEKIYTYFFFFFSYLCFD